MRLMALLLMLVAIGETIGFVGARSITWYRDRRRNGGSFGPFRAVKLQSGVHVHHMVPGLGIAFVAAFVAGVAVHDVTRCVAMAFAGLGAGIFLDQTALIVYVEDVYWDPRGRLSVWVGSIVTGMLWLATAVAWMMLD